jgi:5-methylcytosine-specific restriction endonuclease McrA
MTKREKIRQIVFNKFNGKCAYCGDPLESCWHVDELEPVRRNHIYNKDKHRWEINKENPMMYPERLNINNQYPACPSCNINKHSMSLEGFRTSIYDFIKSLNNNSVQYKIAKKYGLITETKNPVVFYFEKHLR